MYLHYQPYPFHMPFLSLLFYSVPPQPYRVMVDNNKRHYGDNSGHTMGTTQDTLWGQLETHYGDNSGQYPFNKEQFQNTHFNCPINSLFSSISINFSIGTDKFDLNNNKIMYNNNNNNNNCWHNQYAM